jgi:hypothetical protein
LIFIKKYDIIYIESKGKEMIKPMIITEFYVAYVFDREVTHEDIVDVTDTLKEAERLAYERLSGGGDDAGVFINVDSKWYFVFGRDRLSGRLIVSEDVISVADAYVSDWY